ncbi:MAG: PGPGW domain-containing protein [Candidatus Paceibacterota bacterium]
MRSVLKTTAIYTAGIFFLLLGLIGLVLPILQGVLLIAIGLYILSLRWPWLARQKHRLLEKYPFVGRKYAYAHARARSAGKKMSVFKHRFPFL